MIVRNLVIAIGFLYCSLILIAGHAMAQNDVIKPSQRYQPSNYEQIPPSVHLPPQQYVEPLQNNNLRGPIKRTLGSDIALTSYQEPAAQSQEPAVPAILAGKVQETINKASQPVSAAKAAAQNSMERFAAQIDPYYDGPKVQPTIAPTTFEPQAKVTQPPAPAPKVAPAAPAPTRTATKSSAFSVRSQQPAPTQQPRVQPQVQQPRVQPQQQERQPLRSEFQNYDRNVRPASRQVQTESAPIKSNRQAAAISLGAPSLKVETFGPGSIGINKTASFRVEVSNESRIDARDVRVVIDMPSWIEVQNINLSAGNREVGDGQTAPRIAWTIANVPAGQTQSATISAIPRKAEMFDLGVEWTLVPRTGTVNIRVTEPKLEMQMSGPNDVLYGEVAEYVVTIRNQGTGTAENVTVMLPEEFGGDRQNIGDIEAGKEMAFDIELAARTAGQLTLTTNATADGNIKSSVEQLVTVRRAKLGIDITGPALKYAGTSGMYKVTVNNTGDATAADLRVALALPQGAQYIGGVNSVEKREGSVVWPIGSLTPNQSRTFDIECVLQGNGEMQLETGVMGKGDLSAAAACITKVETIADLVLSVQDPKGPLPTGEETTYQITVQNRGSRSAKGVDLLMQFSEGIEPSRASGLPNRIEKGQVVFAPIDQIDPGQTMTFQVKAVASTRGTRIFRAFLSCDESDSREVAEGTTKFFGEDIETASSDASQTAREPSLETKDFRR